MGCEHWWNVSWIKDRQEGIFKAFQLYVKVLHLLLSAFIAGLQGQIHLFILLLVICIDLVTVPILWLWKINTFILSKSVFVFLSYSAKVHFASVKWVLHWVWRENSRCLDSTSSYVIQGMTSLRLAFFVYFSPTLPPYIWLSHIYKLESLSS